jgi:H+/Cl- antiporter ClcA
VGLIGALGGVIYLASNKALSEAMSRGYFSTHPTFRALLGGLGLGLVAVVFSEALFSGNHDLPLLLSTGHIWYIALLMGISKILITALLLSTGWKGGQFLPLMFSGAALGLGLSVIFPAISPIAGVVGGMTGLTTVVMGSPFLVILAVLLMVQNVKLLGIIMSATLIGYGMSRLYSMLQKKIEVPGETTRLEQPLPNMVTSAEEA